VTTKIKKKTGALADTGSIIAGIGLFIGGVSLAALGGSSGGGGEIILVGLFIAFILFIIGLILYSSA